MPTKQLFNEFADIPALQAEKAKVKEIFAEIKASIIELSNVGFKLDAAKSINEIAAAQQNVIKQQQQLITNQNKLTESEARIAKIQAETSVKQEQADLVRTKNLVAQNKELDRQAALQQKVSSNTKVSTSTSANSPDFKPGLSISPLEEASLKDEQENLRRMKTVIDETGMSYQEAEMSAIEWARSVQQSSQAEKEASMIMSELGANVDNVRLKYDEYTGSMAANIKVQYENTASLAANKKEQDAILASIKQSGGATADQTAKLVLLREQEALLNAESKDLTATIRLQAQAMAAEEGSIERMVAELTLLQRAYARLSATEKSGAFGMAIKNEIDVLDPALKKAEEGIGKTGRQVGNYSNAITKSLSGAFGFLRQIAYILPGIGLAGLIGGIMEGVIALTKSMFDFGDSITRDTSRVGQLKENLAAFNAEVRQGTEDLEDYFKYIDRIKEASTINLKINDIDANPLAKLRNELNGLQFDVSNAQTKYLELEEAFSKTAARAGDMQNAFLNGASSDAVQAFRTGTIEFLKEGLSEADKILYDGLTQANAAYNKAGEQLANSFNTRNAAVQKVNEQIKTITKETADEQRQIERDSSIAIENIIKSKNDAVLSNERSTYKERLNAVKSNYAAEKAIINANEKFVLSDPTKSNADKNEAIKRTEVDLQKAQISSEQQQYKIKEEARLREAKAIHDYQESILRDDEAFQRELVDNTIGSIETRQYALDSFTKDQLKSARNNFALQLQQSGFSKKQADEFIESGKYQIEGKKITNDELLTLQRNYESEILGITRSSAQEQTNIVKEEIEKQKKLRQESIDSIESSYSNKDLKSFDTYSDEIIALNKANGSKLMSEEVYQRKRKEIERRYQKQTLSDLIDRLEEELTIYDGSNQRLAGAQAKLFNDRDKLRKLEASKANQYLIERLEREIEVDQAEYESAKESVDKRIELLNKLKKAQGDLSDTTNEGTDEDRQANTDKSLFELEATGQTAQGLTDLSDTIHDKKIQQYEDQKKALEDRYNTEVDYINKVYANSIDKQARLDAAEKKYAQQRNQLDAKEKEEQLKKARFDKANSIFQIIIGTAAAIIRDLGNPFKIAFDATMGAIQLAIASAAPLPHYAKGTLNAKAGKALVGEAGRELGIEPSGRIILWEKPTITTLIAGTKIFPNKVTEDLLAANKNMIGFVQQPKVEVVNNGHDKEILAELKELNSRPPIFINVDYNLTTTTYYQNQIKR